MTGNESPDGHEKEIAMDSGSHQKPVLLSSTGEPRLADVPITIMTALILLIILLFMAVL